MGRHGIRCRRSLGVAVQSCILKKQILETGFSHLIGSQGLKLGGFKLWIGFNLIQLLQPPASGLCAAAAAAACSSRAAASV
jgi:hypothetical protein